MLTIKKFGIASEGGRLGNALFQLNSLIGISEKLNHPYILAGWRHADHFNLNIKTGSLPGNCIQLKETSFCYDMNQFAGLKQGKNYDFIGYLQSEKYFGSKKIQFRNPSLRFIYLLQKYFPDDRKQTVGIHVRRGDYVNNPYYHQLPYIYYFGALERKIPDFCNKRVMIFSDDIEYCREVFPKTSNFVFVQGNTDIEDLFLLSKCDYHILSNSTFSWWGAYLSNSKKIIRPVQYFAGSGLKNDTKDFWPESWEKHDEKS